MSVALGEYDAVVLRTLRYGEADVIAHLFTREHGRRNVIAKGARKARSRLGVRLEPFVAVRAQVRAGRGDLGIVQGVSLLADHERIRTSWSRQQVAAVALDTLARLSVEGVPNEDAYHLTVRFLAELDRDAASDDAARALLAAYQLKLLHTAGLAPQLASCTRCGSTDRLVAWSATDGGMVCATCVSPHDRPVSGELHASAVRAMREPLGESAALDHGHAELTAVRRIFVADMCSEHAGFRPARLDRGR